MDTLQRFSLTISLCATAMFGCTKWEKASDVEQQKADIDVNKESSSDDSKSDAIQVKSGVEYDQSKVNAWLLGIESVLSDIKNSGKYDPRAAHCLTEYMDRMDDSLSSGSTKLLDNAVPGSHSDEYIVKGKISCPWGRCEPGDKTPGCEKFLQWVVMVTNGTDGQKVKWVRML